MAIPEGAVSDLKARTQANPDKAEAEAAIFDSHFGKGAAAKVLGGEAAKPAAKAGNSEGNNATAVAGAIARAKDAIAKGAPRDKVIAKLRAAGIDPGGL